MMFRDERGTTVVEALMAILVLVLGVIGTFSTMDGVKELGMLTEKKQSAARYAQGEIETLRKMGWANLKLNATPAAMADSRGTVASGSYTPPRGGTAQPLVIASTPASCTATTCVSPGPEAWTYGSASGYIYRFITSSHDSLCGSACPAGGTDHIRITVAVTVDAPNGPIQAVVSSSVVVDPAAAPANATQNANPVVSTGGNSIGASTGTTYYFTDTPTGATYSAPSTPHAARNTIGASGVPDQLRVTAPSMPSDLSPTAISYSTDVPPLGDGGLGLASSGTCSGGSTTTAHRWVTPVLNASASVTATGNAAMSMPTSVLPADVNQGKPGKLCISVYSAALNGSNQVTSSTLLGSFSQQLADWPDATELIAFPFRYLPDGTTASIAAGRRLMVQLTVDNASSLAGVALVYDHPNFPASIQLETQ
jgi:hypothetical protein